MERDKTHEKKRLRLVAIQILGLIFLIIAQALGAAEKINTSYISVAPGSSTVIWLAKEARLFEKHGLDATAIFISGSVRGIQAILAGEIPIGEGGGPGLTTARLGGFGLYQNPIWEVNPPNPVPT